MLGQGGTGQTQWCECSAAAQYLGVHVNVVYQLVREEYNEKRGAVALPRYQLCSNREAMRALLGRNQ